jgi:plastocyanin
LPRAFLVLAGLVLALPAVAGTIVGRVSVVEKGGKPVKSLSDVVVYVDGIKAQAAPAKAAVVMRGKSFTPHVAVVPVGGTVEFPNEDPILHNVFSVSGENRFDLQLYKKPKTAAKTFEHPGIVRVYCNIHPQMSAVVVVRDNPFFAKAGADGTFSIEGVPAGRHTVKAWYERATDEAVVEVVVPEAGEARVELRLDASKYRRVQHRNKHGEAYKSDDRY